MPDSVRLEERIGKIFKEKFNVVVPSEDTDLFETGALDSLSFVDLLLELERLYGVHVSLDDLELSNFQSIVCIAEFVAARLESGGDERDKHVASSVNEHSVRIRKV